MSDVVRQLVAGKEFLFKDRGDTELRGFELSGLLTPRADYGQV